MKICKCNGCGKILDRKKDRYFSIGDIEFHSPDSQLTKLHLSMHEEVKEKRESVESWVDYCDLDFCELCFDKTDIKKFL